jgi:raffinose/stachyose/melibiose transport system permease protein
MTVKNKAGIVIGSIVAWLVSLVFIVPYFAVILTSLKTKQDADIISFALPSAIQWDNYSRAIEQGKLVLAFKNSLINSVGSVAILILFVTLASFIISRRRDKLTRFCYAFMLLGLAIPASNITLIKIMQTIGLMNTRPGIILIYVAANAPLALFLCVGFMGSIPRELDEAAIIDGCGPFSLFAKVIFPLLMPIVATLFVLNVMTVWNDFSMPLYFLNNSKMWPMTLAVYNFFGRYHQEWNLVCADAVLTTLPVMILFIFGQKYIVGGLTTGAVKG